MGYSLDLQLKAGLNVKQMQRLMMTHQMQQSLKFLQLPHHELVQEIRQCLLENPLVELDDDFTDDDLILFSRLEREVKGRISESLNEENLIERYVAHKPSLFQHLMEQARCAFSDRELPKVEEIIGHIDERGFLKEGEFDESFVKTIQTFDPVGVGARDLKECFLIQLKAFHETGTLVYKVIDGYFDDLLKNQWGRMSKELLVEEGVLRSQVELQIQRLQFSPASQFSQESEAIIPDFSVVVAGDELRLESKGGDPLPTFSLNQTYLKYLKTAVDKEEKEAIQGNLQSVKALLRSINEREKTLYALGKYLIEKQRSFFLEEEGKILPETMREAAKQLGVHESTVARAVSNKYIECSKGIFPLKHFFKTKYVTDQGEEVSSNAIEGALEALIAEEDKGKPYSDEHLAKLLKENGFQVARRTVAKFREQLKIGNARQRRKGGAR